MKRTVSSVLLSYLFLFLVAVPAQDASPAPPATPANASDAQFGTHRNGTQSTWGQKQAEQMQKEAKAARQKQMKQDAEKLLQLATELKDSVDKTNANVLSLEVVRKAEEIEKLAKHVKTNMRDEMR